MAYGLQIGGEGWSFAPLLAEGLDVLSGFIRSMACLTAVLLTVAVAPKAEAAGSLPGAPDAGGGFGNILGAPASPAEIDQARRYADCTGLASSAPEKALADAREWEGKGGGAPAGHCAALALIGLGRYREAALGLEKLAGAELKERKDLAGSLYDQAAQAWVLANASADAVRDETAAIELEPENVDLLVGRGVILASDGKYQEAVADFSKAHAISGNRADVLIFRATAYRKLNSFALARADLDSAIRLQPSNAEAYLERGIIRMLSKDAHGAASDWQQVMKLGAGTPAAVTAAANLKQLMPQPASSRAAPAAAPPAAAPAQPALSPPPAVLSQPSQPQPSEAPTAEPINPALPLDTPSQ
jgi:tetratricopeptide (TPR) repeat protein